jgi:hypothetical protein
MILGRRFFIKGTGLVCSLDIATPDIEMKRRGFNRKKASLELRKILYQGQPADQENSVRPFLVKSRKNRKAEGSFPSA